MKHEVKILEKAINEGCRKPCIGEEVADMSANKTVFSTVWNVPGRDIAMTFGMTDLCFQWLRRRYLGRSFTSRQQWRWADPKRLSYREWSFPTLITVSLCLVLLSSLTTMRTIVGTPILRAAAKQVFWMYGMDNSFVKLLQLILEKPPKPFAADCYWQLICPIVRWTALLLSHREESGLMPLFARWTGHAGPVLHSSKCVLPIAPRRCNVGGCAYMSGWYCNPRPLANKKTLRYLPLVKPSRLRLLKGADDKANWGIGDD